jgi:hypothetical protein
VQSSGNRYAYPDRLLLRNPFNPLVPYFKIKESHSSIHETMFEAKNHEDEAPALNM